ncbi:MAG: ribonuclease P protein component [Chlamydiae bacterium RIFCSPHIGHO2_12_FULL_27_8]|nr:MAG: ribonuclease P protein component [Chlamydiae bacterium RIFCSPHIGHO2_12_FULL_27_8]
MVKKLLIEEEEKEEKSLQLNFSFPKSNRLKKKFEFQILSRSNRLTGRYIVVNYRLNPQLSHSKLGITVSKKSGSSVKRNYIKRIVRESFRLISNNLVNTLEMNVFFKGKIENVSFKEIFNELKILLNPFLIEKSVTTIPG